jgi:hypothetical protein
VVDCRPDEPEFELDPELFEFVFEFVFAFVVVLVLPVDDVLCAEPGRTAARATAPATPVTPTAAVTAFIRARSRRRLRCGWSNIAGSAPSAAPFSMPSPSAAAMRGAVGRA